jgi:hypothetical protein
MEQPEMRSFEEFWPFYVHEHSHPTNRTLHFVGLTLAMGSFAAGLLTRRPSLLLAAPVLGYGFAWVGHFVIEGNKPATFTYPAWSLRGDFKMWWKTVTGTMEAEVERVMKSNGVHAPTDGAGPAEAGPAHDGAPANDGAGAAAN